jgi:transcriptional regulator with XRE-family HTH domain
VPGRRPADQLTPLGQRLEALRLEHGHATQADAATHIGISVRTYGRLLHHEEPPPTGSVIRKILAAYDLDPRDLADAVADTIRPPSTPGNAINGELRLIRLEHKLDLILNALITSGAIPDPPDELRDLIAGAATPKRRRRRTT